MSPVCAVARAHAADERSRGERRVEPVETAAQAAQLVRAVEGRWLPPRPRGAAPGIAAELQRFVERVLEPSDAGWSETIDRLRGDGVAVETIYIELLAPAARVLGEMWEDDRVMFSDVTVALGRLHRIMRGLSPALAHDLPLPAESRRVLLIPAPDEQHTFGLSMVAEFFRRAGWEVVCELDGRSVDPVRRVRREWFDVVGISVGVDTRLEWLRSGVATIRRASRNRALAVVVGGPAFARHPERAAELGADACVPDAAGAPVLAASLVDERVGRS